MIINIIIWLMLGGMAGYLAAFIMGSRGDSVTNIIIGVTGAMFSTLMINSSNTINVLNATGFYVNNLSVAFIGATVFTLVFQVFKQSKIQNL